MKNRYQILLAALLASMLVGCGKTDEAATNENTENPVVQPDYELSEKNDDAQQADDAQTDDTQARKIEITIARPYHKMEEEDEAQIKKVENAINAYLEDKMNVQIRLKDIPAREYMDQVEQAIERKEVDLLWTASWMGTVGKAELIEKNAAYDITDFVAETPLYRIIEKPLWDCAKYNGRNYFIPLVSTTDTEGYELIARKELAQKYDWTAADISKWQDIEPLLEDCVAEGVDYPFLMQSNGLFRNLYVDDFDFFTGDAASNWVAIDRDTNEVVDTILTPQFREYVAQIAEWTEKGYVFHDDRMDVNLRKFAEHWGFSLSMCAADTEKINEQVYQQEMISIPITGKWYFTDSGQGRSYCIAADSPEEKVEACLAFLELLHTDRVLADLYTYGIEGENFVYNEAGQAVQTREGYGHFAWEAVSANAVSPADTDPVNLGELCQELNRAGRLSDAAGFHFDSSPVAEKYWACRAVWSEYGSPLECGKYAVSEIDDEISKYHELLDEAGLQTVLAEFQRQYEAWK